MKVLIVDDEALARDRCRRLLDEIGGYQCVGEASHGEEALSQVEALAPDVLLLDVHMPGLDGMAVAQRLAQRTAPPLVIFTTAYGEYALDAFEVAAVAYVLKPIRKEKLAQALERAAALHQGTAQDDASTTPPNDGLLRLYMKGGYRQIARQEVLYLSALKKFTLVYTTSHEEFLVEDSLKKLHLQHPDYFLRIHRTTLVAAHAIRVLQRQPSGQQVVSLHGVEPLFEVSRRHLADVRAWLKYGQITPPHE